jgi:16S rRNA (guanine527-N7)-methyltransferase
MNLTAIRAPGDVLRKHLLDSLSVATRLVGGKVLDVGTGAGFPGLPLAIAVPSLSYLLVDSTAKKIRFVETACAALALGNVRALHARAEALEESADTVLARAVAPLPKLLREAGGLIAPGGRLLAMKGRLPEEELKDLPAGYRVAKVERLSVPGLDEERHLVTLRRS